MPRTRVKLAILDKYLGAWFSIIAHKFSEAIYFDGFCGPGKYEGGEKGSPLVALKHATDACELNPRFRPTMIFSDINPQVTAHLRDLIASTPVAPEVRVIIVEDGFSVGKRTALSQHGQRRYRPMFSFVDPFGLKIPLRDVLDLVSPESSECFINFMAGWSNRFINHPDEDVAAHVRELLGGEFRDEVLGAVSRTEAILDIYRRQLGQRARFVRVFRMYDEGNALDNALIFVGNNSRGFVRMKEAMWSLDPEFGNRFSAYEEMKIQTQSRLIEGQPQIRSLQAALRAKIENGPIKVHQLKLWVDEDTDFLQKHLKTALENAWQHGEITYVDPSPTGRKRQVDHWPDRLLIEARK